jgi:hypothetical protein
VLSALQVVTLVLVALAMAPAVAHALELPGKMRLSRDVYLQVQPIYYPGFTFVGGAAEILGLLSTFISVLLIPRGTPAFWLTLCALVALVVMHAVFWLVTQPVNRYWLREYELGSAGKAVFRTNQGAAEPHEDWSSARDKWEHSHVVRAMLVTVALILLAAALAAS